MRRQRKEYSACAVPVILYSTIAEGIMDSSLTLLQSIALATIQGVTEFLPISSSGHLVIIRTFFHWSDQNGLLFDTILHAGSLLAILLYFRRDWLAILRGYRNPNDPQYSWYRRLPWLLIVATLPIVLIGPWLKPVLESKLIIRNSVAVGLGMLATAFFFWLSEHRLAPSRRPLAWRQALLIGCLQIVALLPGASRSGWTTGAGMLCGQSREGSVRFAFLMALPAIAGAVILQVKDIAAAGLVDLLSLRIGVGLLVSFLASLGAIHFCLMFFRKYSLRFFAIYLALAGLLLVFYNV